MAENELVDVFEATDMGEIIQARLALETADIPFVVIGETTGATEWITSANPTVFKVALEHADAARAALEDFMQE